MNRREYAARRFARLYYGRDPDCVIGQGHPAWTYCLNHADVVLKIIDELAGDRAYARRGDPSTAQDAAGRVNLPPRMQRVLAALEEAGNEGLTLNELADKLAVPLVNVSSVPVRLVRRGLAHVDGSRPGGPAQRQRIVYKAGVHPSIGDIT